MAEKNFILFQRLYKDSFTVWVWGKSCDEWFQGAVERLGYAKEPRLNVCDEPGTYSKLFSIGPGGIKRDLETGQPVAQYRVNGHPTVLWDFYREREADPFAPILCWPESN
jgi:hypothetical protein